MLRDSFNISFSVRVFKSLILLYIVPPSRIRPPATVVAAPLHPALYLAYRLMLLMVAPLEYPLSVSSHLDLTRFNKIAIQGTPQMAVDKEDICLSRVYRYSYYPKCNFPLFYV